MFLFFFGAIFFVEVWLKDVFVLFCTAFVMLHYVSLGVAMFSCVFVIVLTADSDSSSKTGYLSPRVRRNIQTCFERFSGSVSQYRCMFAK